MGTTSKEKAPGSGRGNRTSPDGGASVFAAPLATQEQRNKQIDAFAMNGPKKTKSKDGWLNTVGKYPADSPLSRIFDEGEKIRQAERTE